MVEPTIHRLIAQVRRGRLTRRAFVDRLATLGLSAPLATLLLAHQGLAQVAGTPPPYKPTRRGGGGPLRVLMWQGPTILQPHFAIGSKDLEGGSLFYEPLARWDDQGQLQPVLAAEIPSRDNGGLAADGRSATWKLKRGVTWHDGAPFSADDVVFSCTKFLPEVHPRARASFDRCESITAPNASTEQRGSAPDPSPTTRALELDDQEHPSA